jgi:dipeptidyl aminopeptidase/acylaminoacyl peptidase
MRFPKLLVLVVGLGLAACSSDPAPADPSNPNTPPPPPPPPPEGCKVNLDCAASVDTPVCDVASGECGPLPPGYQIGYGDSSPASVSFALVHEQDKLRQPTDLAFNPSKLTELWVVNRLDDSTIIIQNPGAPEMTSERRHDPAATHFMDRPPAIAFGSVDAEWGQTFAVCGDSDNGGDDFMGAALFTADLDVYAKPTPDGLGSHLDMLHSTSFCRGLAHYEANVYWVFNSDKGSIDKYDFKDDHGPGADDHSDGEIYRYIRTTLTGVTGIPSHLAFDLTSRQLYIADTGSGRIMKLDTTSGTVGASFSGDEPALRRYMDDAVVTDVVAPGVLTSPSGLELHDGILFVSDHATSRFYAFDLEGKLLRQLDTGFAPESLAGFTFGPDGKIYFVDMLTSRVHRLDPLP